MGLRDPEWRCTSIASWFTALRMGRVAHTLRDVSDPYVVGEERRLGSVVFAFGI